MNSILETLTDGQPAELVRRLYERGGDIQKAVLEEAEALLGGIDFEEIAEEVFCNLDLLDVEELWNDSGATAYGYISTEDCALTMIRAEVDPFVDQLWKYFENGMRVEAQESLKGVLLGLYLFAHESNSDFNEWSVDMPEDLFAALLDNWRKKTKNFQEDTIDSFCKEWCPEWV